MRKNVLPQTGIGVRCATFMWRTASKPFLRQRTVRKPIELLEKWLVHGKQISSNFKGRWTVDFSTFKSMSADVCCYTLSHSKVFRYATRNVATGGVGVQYPQLSKRENSVKIGSLHRQNQIAFEELRGRYYLYISCKNVQ